MVNVIDFEEGGELRVCSSIAPDPTDGVRFNFVFGECSRSRPSGGDGASSSAFVARSRSPPPPPRQTVVATLEGQGVTAAATVDVVGATSSSSSLSSSGLPRPSLLSPLILREGATRL